MLPVLVPNVSPACVREDLTWLQPGTCDPYLLILDYKILIGFEVKIIIRGYLSWPTSLKNNSKRSKIEFYLVKWFAHLNRKKSGLQKQKKN